MAHLAKTSSQSLPDDLHWKAQYANSGLQCWKHLCHVKHMVLVMERCKPCILSWAITSPSIKELCAQGTLTFQTIYKVILICD